MKDAGHSGQKQKQSKVEDFNYSTGLADMKFRCCHLLPKSRLNMKLKINNTMAHVF